MGVNLSAWALSHRSFIIFVMIASMVAGAISYTTLGRNEDPPFTFRTMVVQANWPGATLEETVEQVTERLERKLQEVENVDFLRSFTRAGVTRIFVNLKGSTPPEQVPDLWYDVRKKIGDIRHTLPQGVVGPFFNDEFGDTFGIIYGFTADGFTQRQLRDYVEDARSRLLLVPDVTKIDLLGAQDEQIFIEFSIERLAGLGLNQAAILAGLQAQNVVRPAGVVRTGDEEFALRVTGAFESEEDILEKNFVADGRLLRLRDIATVRRGYADPPQSMFRVNGEPAIGLAIAMRDGGDVLGLGANVEAAIKEITADLPVGITPVLVANQPQVVDEAINEFMVSLWQAIAIILVISFVALGGRAGLVVALSFPLTLAIVFPVMQIADIDLQRISLGALIIALGLLVDNAMTTIDVVTVRLAAGDDKVRAASYAYESRRHADADGHVHHRGGIRADRLCRELGRRVHVLDLRGGLDRAAGVLGGGRADHAAARGVADEGAGQAVERARQGHVAVPRPAGRRDAGALAHHRRSRSGRSCWRSSACRLCRDSSSPRRTAPSCSST